MMNMVGFRRKLSWHNRSITEPILGLTYTMRNLRRTDVPTEIRTELLNISLIIKVYIIIKSVFGKRVYSKFDYSFSRQNLLEPNYIIPTALSLCSLHKVSRTFSRGGGFCFYCETSEDCHVVTASR
jgi:hypothetical protein